MKPKVAIGFYGQYRTFEYCFPFSIYGDMDVDFYMSTWDVSYDLRKYIVPNDDNFWYDDIDKKYGLILNTNQCDYYRKITKEDISKIIPNSNIFIQNNIYSQSNLLLSNTTNWLYHIKKVNEMIIDSNIKYDYVILQRPDIIVCINDINKFEINTLYHFGFWNQPTENEDINDLSKYNIMDTFWASTPDIIHKFVKDIPCSITPHAPLAHFIHHQKFKQSDINTLSPFAKVSRIIRYTAIPMLKKFMIEDINPLINNWTKEELDYFHDIIILGDYVPNESY